LVGTIDNRRDDINRKMFADYAYAGAQRNRISDPGVGEAKIGGEDGEEEWQAAQKDWRF
jgi:hypothetical protein